MKIRVHELVCSAAGEVGDVAYRQLPLRDWGCSCRSVKQSTPIQTCHVRSMRASTPMVLRLGAQPGDLVAFENILAAAERLNQPSSVARAIAAGAPMIERVDKLVQIIGGQFGSRSQIERNCCGGRRDYREKQVCAAEAHDLFPLQRKLIFRGHAVASP